MARFNPQQPAVTGNIVRIVTQVQSQSQIYETIFDYMAASFVGLNGATINSVILGWLASSKTPFLACLPPTATLVNVLGQDMNPGTTPTQQVAPVAALGTAGATSLAGTVAAVLTKYSALKGQRGRGRNYMMAIPNTFVTPATDPNAVNAVGIAAYNALKASLLVVIVAGGVNWNLVISQRITPPASVIAFAGQVTSITPEAIMGTVRRRREGRGI